MSQKTIARLERLQHLTRITNARTEEAFFLGTILTIGNGGEAKVVQQTTSKGKTIKRRSTGWAPIMKAPLDKLLKRLSERGFCGASCEGVMKVGRGEASEESEAQYRRLLRSNDVLVQEFLPEIAQGETSAVFFNNHFSHAVVKVPKTGEFRTNYDLGVTVHSVTLSTEHKARVERLYTQCEQDVLYARLDFVQTAKGIRLMELELIEPYLFFDYKEGAADDFVKAFEQRIERK